MLGVCYGPQSLPLRSDCKMLAPVEGPLLTNCGPEGKRRLFRVFVPQAEGIWSPMVHSDCQHNELASLALRTMAPTPPGPHEYDETTLGLFREMRRMVEKLNVQRMGLLDVAMSYGGALRRRYLEAHRSLDEDGWLTKADWKLSGFLKAEKQNPVAKVSKPRMINPRSPRYNLVLASYLKPLEHALWRKWKFGGNGCRRSRVSGKGLNAEKRAKLLEQKMADVGDCVAFEVDGAAFEAHVEVSQLKLEHGVYKAAFPRDGLLAELLSKQLTLSGTTKGKVRYFRKGCRASGDYNTGMGNTILMGNFSISALKRMGLTKPYTLLADGDNCLIFVHRSEAKLVHANFGAMMAKVCSHEMVVEKPTMIVEGLTFGQSQPVRTAAGIRMVRNIYKTLGSAFCGHRHYHDKVFGPRVLRSVILAELALSRGVPVVGPYFAEAERLTRFLAPVKNPDVYLEGHLLDLPPDRGDIPITAATRESFEWAFDLDPFSN